MDISLELNNLRISMIMLGRKWWIYIQVSELSFTDKLKVWINTGLQSVMDC